MIRKLLFLPLILLFISCTVTKRVHRPGYHIQWNTTKQTQKSVEKKSKIKEGKEAISQDELILELTQIEEINNEIDLVVVTDGPKIEDRTSLVEVHDLKRIPSENEDIGELFQPSIKPASRSISQNSQAPIFWRTPPENLRKLGIALMIIGGIILWGSLLVYAGAFSGNGDGGWLNFFLDLIDLSGWFWLLFFILAIILVSYLSFLFVLNVLGGPLVGLIVGLGIAGLGLFFYIIGKRRVPEPPN